MIWTSEKIAQLKELWGKMSTAAIGDRIEGANKNKVIGKAHRLGLEKLQSGPPRLKNHCVKGHEYPADIKIDSGGRRRCKICINARLKAKREMKKAARREGLS